MKIGIVIDRFDPHRGGAESWTFQFVRQLLKRAYEIHVVAEEFSPAVLDLPIIPHPLGEVVGA